MERKESKREWEILIRQLWTTDTDEIRTWIKTLHWTCRITQIRSCYLNLCSLPIFCFLYFFFIFSWIGILCESQIAIYSSKWFTSTAHSHSHSHMQFQPLYNFQSFVWHPNGTAVATISHAGISQAKRNRAQKMKKKKVGKEMKISLNLNG